MDAVVGDEMRPQVERARAAARPGMGHLEIRDLRHPLGRVGVKLGALLARGGGLGARAPQEQDARAVGRTAQRDHVVDMVDIGAVGRQQLFHQRRIERLGRDHIGVERNDAALQPRPQIARIAVGRDQHLLRARGTLRGGNIEPVAVAADAGDGRAADQRDAGRTRAVQQTLVVEAGMDRGQFRDQRAAVEQIAGDLFADLGLRHHLELGAQMLAPPFELVGQVVVLALGLGHDQTAADLEAAIDLFLLDALGDGIERALHLAIDGDGVRVAPALLQVAETVLQRLADIARVARGGAVAQILGVQHDDLAAGTRQVDRGIQAREARAHDGHVHILRRRLGHGRHARRGLPPIGRVLEIGCEDVRAHGGPRSVGHPSRS